jgi:hypothetical protein
LDHWIFTVNDIDETGLPLLAVPVSVAVVVPGGLLPFPPPQATIQVHSVTTSAIQMALLARLGFRLSTRKSANKAIPMKARTADVSHTRMLGSPGCVRPLDAVSTVTVNGTFVVLDVNETEDGLNEQLAPLGKPEHAKLTVPV